VFSCYFKTELASTLLQLTSAGINLVIGPMCVVLICLRVPFVILRQRRLCQEEREASSHQIFKGRNGSEGRPIQESHSACPIWRTLEQQIQAASQTKSWRRPPYYSRKTSQERWSGQGLLYYSRALYHPHLRSLQSTGNRPRPAAQPLPSGSPVVKPAASSASRGPPALPGRDRPPPSVPEEPDVPMYRAKYAFEGQAGELSLVKDDLVELVEKDDNGWWLVKKGTEEGWAPNNYLDLVPPKPKAALAPPPATRRPPAPPTAPVVAPKPAAAPTQQARINVQSLTANASAKPISVFPGMAPSNGTAAPWKKTPVASTGTTPVNSRPSSTAGAKPPPPAPPVGKKPAPPPPVASKPSTGPKVPGRPPVPSATRPPPAPTAPRPGGVKPSGGALGQLDLAAAVRFFSAASVTPMLKLIPSACEARSEDGRE
jgi:myosin-1